MSSIVFDSIPPMSWPEKWEFGWWNIWVLSREYTRREIESLQEIGVVGSGRFKLEVFTDKVVLVFL